MGVSFKVAKIGTRFRPKPVQSSEAAALEDNSNGNSSFGADSTSIANHKPQADVTEAGEDAAGISGSSSCSGGQLTSPDHEVSFSLNLYRDGYSIGKPSENGTTLQSSLQDIPKTLHPYDRTSETFFSAIESGRLPGDILDDIPSKYFEGVLVCEVRDFRKCGTEAGSGISMLERSPIITKVHLRMSLENVVKDMPLISDDSWTYSDLMEVESRIVKVLQPRLCLDPTPMLDRLSNDPVPTKIDLGLSSARKRRLRQIPGVTVTSNNQAHGKKVCIDRVSESENGRAGDFITLSGDTPTQNVFENMNGHSVPNNILPLRPRNLPEASTSSLPSLPLKYHVGNGHPKPMQDRVSVSNVSTSGVSPGGRDAVISCTDTMSSTVSSLHGKRENLDASLTPLSKRARQTALDVDPNQQQQFGSQLENLPGADMPWNNQLLHPQSDPRGASYASIERQKYTQKVLEGAPNQDTSLSSPYLEQQAPRYGVKQERIETENDRNRSDLHPLDNESNLLDPQQSRVQQRLPQHPILRQNFPSQMQWHNLGQVMDREQHLQKRKPVQSPRVSASLGPSPAVSSKSGEFSSGSFGPQFNTVAMSTAFGSSQKEKATTISSAVAGGAPSVASSPGDSIPRQQPATTAAKRRSNSLPKTPSTSGVGSPASVGNMSVPLSASSPPVGSPCLADQAILERFSKIEMVTMRHGLNVKKNKVDDYPVHRATGYSTELLSSHLSSASSSEDFKDSSCRWPLSKSLVGGSMNVRKIRVMDFVHGERRLQGNMVTFIPKVRRRLIMSEKQNDGTVAMRYGEPDDSDPLASEDYLPTLPTTHYADALAAQFTALMTREGYQYDDHVQPKPAASFSSSQPNVSGVAVEIQQHPNNVPRQPSGAVATPVTSGNPFMNQTQNHLPGTRVLPHGNNQGLQMSQGLMPGAAVPANLAQQLDSQGSLQQQQQQQQNQMPQIQQHAQLQRPSMMLPGNSLSHLNAIGQNSNVQLGSHMVNKPSPLQLQMLQQQQQPQQQQQQQQQQQAQQPQPQQQQQQQQQPQMQRKMMMGLGTAMGLGNMGNNMVGLSGIGNIMGLGSVRGIGGAGMSSPMGPMSGMGNMGQNPMNLSQASNFSNVINQHFRSGNINPAQVAAMAKLRMVQNRTGILGGPQSGIAGMSGAGHMHPGSAGMSMLGQTLNRANLSPLQRTTMASMGPPKSIPGANFYMNQQQQQQLQQQQQMQQQQQQQQQQQLHQQQAQAQQSQQIGSPLQAVVSPQQVGSPTLLPQQLVQQPQQPQQQQQQQQQQISPQPMMHQSPQQMIQQSPQQMIQQSPMSPQLSSGTLPPMSTASAGAPPASPQLSSQTLGSVGSMTSSPMELQGVNKSNSVGNV